MNFPNTAVVGIALGASLGLSSVGCTGAEPTSTGTANFRPTATIQDIMVSMVDPGADGVWNAVATIVTHDGIEERRPRTDEEWEEVRHSAVRLLEATNLLLMEGRTAAAPGIESEFPEVELHPEQIDELIAKDPGTWRRLVDGLYDEAKIMLDAVDAKDADALFENGGPLDRACENCHQAYWYPDAIRNPPKPGVAPVPPSMRRDKPVAQSGQGTIEGHVRLSGELPGNPVIRMGRDPYCAALNEGRLAVQETVVTQRDGSLANVFARLDGAFPASDVPADPVVVDQRDCFFTPRVVGVRAGQVAQFHNSDDFLHNVRTLAAAPANAFNVAQPMAGMVYEAHFEPEDGMIRLQCDRHPWMTAYIGVSEHPYFAVSDENGAFTMRNVPAGTYRLKAWHERYGLLTQEVVVEPGSVAVVDLAFESSSSPTTTTTTTGGRSEARAPSQLVPLPVVL